MNLLLDTHALLWMVSDDDQLTASARGHMIKAELLLYSVASFWEIAIKQSLQPMDFQLKENWHDSLIAELKINGIRRLDILTDHCTEVEHLPWHHRDPFDRLLVAQAKHEEVSLLSCDKRLSQYDVNVVW